MDVIKVSFTKENVLKAIKQINSHKNNHDCILDECVDDEEYVDDSYIDTVNKAMCTDKLIDYLNKNCISGLKTVEFGNTINLGHLGSAVDASNEFYAEHNICFDYYEKITDEKLCLVGYADCEGGSYGSYTKFGTTETYITEQGNVVIVNVTDYGVYFEGEKEPEILLTVRTITNDETPLMNSVDDYFPEKYKGFYSY